MQIVTDTSVLLAVILGEPERDRLIAATVGHDLVGPASIPWEMGNAFSAMLKRHRVGLAATLAGADAMGRIPMRLLPVDMRAALIIAADHGLYAYDAYFVECALMLGAPLITLDRRLQEAARRAGARTVEV
ncbi:MAG: type II toxin-antitoxin system VapC family toxin [Armatimonadetes bacterium]|nr:type II toxin-antitoxin system VapC family toxin [Armatimonadota bacterium]